MAIIEEIDESTMEGETQSVAQPDQRPCFVPDAAAPVSMPPEQMQEVTLRAVVVRVAVSIAIYFLVATLLQLWIFSIGVDYYNNLRGLDIVDDSGLRVIMSVPSYLMRYAIPGLVIAMLYGFLFAMCGCIGVKANSSFCAGCFCGCSAGHGVLVVLGIISSALFSFYFIHTFDAETHHYLKRCEPDVCVPPSYLDEERSRAAYIDCLAKGAWGDKYTPMSKNGPSLPSNCPMFLSCTGNKPERPERTPSPTYYWGANPAAAPTPKAYSTAAPPAPTPAEWHRSEAYHLAPHPVAVPLARNPYIQQHYNRLPGETTPAWRSLMAFDGIDSNAMHDSRWLRHVHHHVMRMLTSKGFQRPRQCTGNVSADCVNVLARPMPDDPIKQCFVVEKNLDAYHEARHEVSTAYWILRALNTLCIMTEIPLAIMFTIAFSFGYGFWSRLNDTSYRQTYQAQGEPSDQQGVELGVLELGQMAQPLI